MTRRTGHRPSSSRRTKAANASAHIGHAAVLPESSFSGVNAKVWKALQLGISVSRGCHAARSLRGKNRGKKYSQGFPQNQTRRASPPLFSISYVRSKCALAPKDLPIIRSGKRGGRKVLARSQGRLFEFGPRYILRNTVLLLTDGCKDRAHRRAAEETKGPDSGPQPCRPAAYPPVTGKRLQSPAVAGIEIHAFEPFPTAIRKIGVMRQDLGE